MSASNLRKSDDQFLMILGLDDRNLRSNEFPPGLRQRSSINLIHLNRIKDVICLTFDTNEIIVAFIEIGQCCLHRVVFESLLKLSDISENNINQRF